MKELFKRHYKAIQARNLINKDTDIFDFFEKSNEEMIELAEAFDENSQTRNQEAIDFMIPSL